MDPVELARAEWKDVREFVKGGDDFSQAYPTNRYRACSGLCYDDRVDINRSALFEIAAQLVDGESPNAVQPVLEVAWSKHVHHITVGEQRDGIALSSR